MNKFKARLSLTPIQEQSFSELRVEGILEELEEIGEINKGEIAICPTFIYEEETYIEIGTFVINGTEDNISENRIPVGIYDSNGNNIGGQIFLINDLIGLEPLSARPYNFKFNKENLKLSNTNKDEITLKIQEDMSLFNTFYLDIENLPEDFPKERLVEIKNQLRVDVDTIKFSPIQIENNENGDIELILLVNNGYKEQMSSEWLPITIQNQKDEVIVSEMFNINLENLTPLKSRIVTIVIDKKDHKIEFNEEDLYRVTFTVID